MDSIVTARLPLFLDALGLREEPMGLIYTNEEPDGGFSPSPLPLPTRERESRGEINWLELRFKFSCVMGNIWRARRKGTRAWFSAERFGCPGGGFWLGFLKPQTETIIRYISTGLSGFSKGERYCSSPDVLRRVLGEIDPIPAPGRCCVIQPLSQFNGGAEPRFVLFFARGESLAGLHQLAFFVTDDPDVVASPWGAACGGIATWPLRYEALGRARAVLGGWDPSARKHFKTDEYSFTVPWSMFLDMLSCWQDSFLGCKVWSSVRAKIDRSRKAWGE